jgi:hypothetical protein
MEGLQTVGEGPGVPVTAGVKGSASAVNVAVASAVPAGPEAGRLQLIPARERISKAVNMRYVFIFSSPYPSQAKTTIPIIEHKGRPCNGL